MKTVAKTLLSGSTTVCILSGTFSWLGIFLVGWGGLLVCKSLLLMYSQNKQSYNI